MGGWKELVKGSVKVISQMGQSKGSAMQSYSRDQSKWSVKVISQSYQSNWSVKGVSQSDQSKVSVKVISQRCQSKWSVNQSKWSVKGVSQSDQSISRSDQSKVSVKVISQRGQLKWSVKWVNQRVSPHKEVIIITFLVLTAKERGLMCKPSSTDRCYDIHMHGTVALLQFGVNVIIVGSSKWLNIVIVFDTCINRFVSPTLQIGCSPAWNGEQSLLLSNWIHCCWYFRDMWAHSLT